MTDLDELVCVVAAAGFVAVALTPRGRVLVRPDHPDAWPRLTTLTARLAARWPHLEALPADVAAHAPPGSDLAAARPLAGSAPTPPV